MQLAVIIIAILCIKGKVSADVLSYLTIVYAVIDLIVRFGDRKKVTNEQETETR